MGPIAPIAGVSSRSTVLPCWNPMELPHAHLDRRDPASLTNNSTCLSGADTDIFTLYRFRQRRIERDTDPVLHSHGITEGSDGTCANMIGTKVALS